MNEKKKTPEIKNITSAPADMRRQLLRKLSKMSEDEILDLFELQLSLIRKHLKEFRTSPELGYGTLIEALAKRVSTEEILTRKNSEGDAKRLLKMRLDALSRAKEGKKERTYRIRYHGLVTDLRNQGTGWRTCSEYLQKHHRFKISYSHLKKLFEKYSEF